MALTLRAQKRSPCAPPTKNIHPQRPPAMKRLPGPYQASSNGGIARPLWVSLSPFTAVHCPLHDQGARTTIREDVLI